MRTRIERFYPYRTALVTDVFMMLDRTTETINSFERPALEELNERPDNHSVIEIAAWRNGERIPIFIACDDSTYMIGFGIEEC